MNKAQKLNSINDELINISISNSITNHIIENNIDVENISDIEISEIIGVLTKPFLNAGVSLVSKLGSQTLKSTIDLVRPVIKDLGHKALEAGKEQVISISKDVAKKIADDAKQQFTDYAKNKVEKAKQDIIGKTSQLIKNRLGKGRIFLFTYTKDGQTKHGEITAKNSNEAGEIALKRYGNSVTSRKIK